MKETVHTALRYRISMALPSMLVHLRNGIVLLSLFITSMYCVKAQGPDLKNITSRRDQLSSIINYGKNCLKQQKFDEAIKTAHSGLALSRQSSLDSFEAAFEMIVAQAYVSKAIFDSAGYYLKQCQGIVNKHHNVTLQANINLSWFAIYNRLGKADSTIMIINKFRTLLPDLDSTGGERARIEMYFGHNDRRQARYSDALQHYFKALSLFSALKDSVNTANINSSIATVYSNMEQPDKALSYYHEAIRILRQTSAKTYLAIALVNAVDLYYNNHLLDSAEVYVKEAMDIVTSINERTLIAHCYLLLGNIYRERKQFEQSEAFFSRCVQMTQELHMDNDLLNSYKGLGQIYMAMGNPGKATLNLQKSLALAQKNKNNEMLIEIYGHLARNASNQHDYASAYEYQKQYTVFKDSAYSESVSKSVADMEFKYQTEKKEKEIILLKKDQQIRKTELQKQRTIQIASFVLLGLMIVIGLLAVNRYRLVQRSKRLAEIEKMRNDIARDLHDDIGSTLSSIHIKSKMALSNASQEGLVMTQLQKIREHSGKMMESMGDIVWAINPVNDSLEKLVIRMKTFAAEILEPLNVSYVFREYIELKTLKMDVGRRKEMYLIFKEAINNAAKYSGCTEISVDFNGNSGNIILKISDDGKGFDTSTLKEGNGLNNMRTRAKNIDAQFDLVSAPGKGTTVTVVIPVT